jgi:Cu(I)/Ag(I) efflux system membrane protein CusA/SilA
MKWSGRYEYMERAQQRLLLVVPFTLLIIFFLLYVHFKNVTEVLIVLLAIPFSLVGGVWLMYALGYNMSVAVAVGFIALAGVAAETGVVMIVYLDEAWNNLLTRKDQSPSLTELRQAVVEGAVQRVRPKMMTVCTTIIALLPIMWSNGTGADTMKRIAAPMIGGLVSSSVLILVIIPAVYYLWRSREIISGKLRQPPDAI